MGAGGKQPQVLFSWLTLPVSTAWGGGQASKCGELLNSLERGLLKLDFHQHPLAS